MILLICLRATVTILIYDSFSLKDKRSVVKSILNKAKNKFNISICESDFYDIHNKSQIGISCVATNTNGCDKIIESFLNFVISNYNVEILNTTKEHY